MKISAFKLLELQKKCDEGLEEARKQKIEGAINWGDLSCRRVCYSVDQDEKASFIFFISEADPSNQELHYFLYDFIKEKTGIENIEIITEW